MKKTVYFIVLLFISAIIFAGCREHKKTEDPGVSSGEYPFVNVSWTRDAENDTETIRFGEDGSFSYSCGCGNPVNDSDLCEGYTYDESAKTVTLNCSETTDEMVTVITIVKCDENSLHLDFDGEIRIFTKETEIS